MNTRLLFLLSSLALAFLSVEVNAQTTHDVTVGNNFFSPDSLTIQVGDTVRWTNPADNGPPHDVSGDGFSTAIAESFVFSHIFTQAGIEEYLCTVHPATMRGTITVQGSGGGEVDLSLTEIGVNNNIVYQPGGSIAIDTEVDNVGSMASAAYSVSFYLSDNAQISLGDTLLGSSNRAALGVGNSDNFTANMNLPGNLTPGSYFIGGIIDIDDANNNNNTNLEDETISVQGSSGGGGFALNPGHNGNWWTGPLRNGEGVQIEVSDNGAGGFVLVATMYSYNPQGDPIFLLAVGQVVNGEAAVEVFIFEGPVWGSAFNPADLVETTWGSGLFTSSSCDAVSMVLTPNTTFAGMGYSELTAELIRLTISAIPCPLP